MKNIIAKVLLGISAMAVAGALSFVPATNVSAYDFTSSNILVEHEEEDGWWEIDGGAAGTINFSYTGTGSLVPEDACLWVSRFADNSSIIWASVWFGDEVPEGASGYADFSFEFGGEEYKGRINLTNGYYDLYNDDLYDLSLFLQTPTAFYRTIDSKVNDIVKAAQGIGHDGSENPQKVVFYDCKGAVNYRIIQALAQTQGVTLFYTFEYQGYVFTSAITSEMAAQIFIEGEDWYGPCYIAKYCPTVLVDVVK